LARASQISPPTKLDGETGRGGEAASRGAFGEAAQRALAEAEERRLKAGPPLPPEINGRDGPEPVRYGDWEVKGLASDF
jgi:hypothetical protein